MIGRHEIFTNLIASGVLTLPRRERIPCVAGVAYEDSLLGGKPVPRDPSGEPVFEGYIREPQRCPHSDPLDVTRGSKISLGSVYFCFAAPLGLSARPVRFEMLEEELPRSCYGLVQS